jgi:argininosuccinate synthase
MVIDFVAGVPVAIDGQTMGLADLVAHVDRRAGAHGVGRIDMIEDRLVGIKSREIYECPGAITLITAHRDLEDLCLEQELAEHKRGEEGRYAQLIYNGLWWGPLKRALDAFMDEASRYVNGQVRVQLFKGHATVVGRRSEDSGLYNFEMATYDEGDQFDQTLAEGFVKLWGLPLKTWAERARSLGDNL